MERHNDKYGIDCFSNSELNSKSDEGEDYRYEPSMKHSYKQLKSVDVSVKMLKCKIHFIFFHLIL